MKYIKVVVVSIIDHVEFKAETFEQIESNCMFSFDDDNDNDGNFPKQILLDNISCTFYLCRLWHISRSECLCCFQHIDFVTAICFHPRVRELVLCLVNQM